MLVRRILKRDLAASDLRTGSGGSAVLRSVSPSDCNAGLDSAGVASCCAAALH